MEEYRDIFILVSVVVTIGALIGAIVGVALARSPASTRLRSVLKGAAVGIATLALFTLAAVLVLVYQTDWTSSSSSSYTS